MSNNYDSVILEEVRSQYRAIQGGLDNLQGLPEKVDQISQDVV